MENKHTITRISRISAKTVKWWKTTSKQACYWNWTQPNCHTHLYLQSKPKLFDSKKNWQIDWCLVIFIIFLPTWKHEFAEKKFFLRKGKKRQSIVIFFISFIVYSICNNFIFLSKQISFHLYILHTLFSIQNMRIFFAKLNIFCWVTTIMINMYRMQKHPPEIRQLNIHRLNSLQVEDMLTSCSMLRFNACKIFR